VSPMRFTGRQISPMQPKIKIMVNPLLNGRREATDIDPLFKKMIAQTQ
jgi:hypothetical protein